MTKRREPLTYHLAVTRAAAVIGWDRLAALCGVSARSVRLWSDPDCETEIRMIDAERIDCAVLESGETVAPFQQLYNLRLNVAANGNDAGPLDPGLIADVAKKSGEAVAALIAASTAGASPAQRRMARQEIEEAIAVMTASLASLGKDPAHGQ